MKTAISLPDELFDSAEQFSKRMGLSRSELFAKAVELYLQLHNDQGVTEMLDRIYGETEAKLDKQMARMQFQSLSDERW